MFCKRMAQVMEEQLPSHLKNRPGPVFVLNSTNTSSPKPQPVQQLVCVSTHFGGATRESFVC